MDESELDKIIKESVEKLSDEKIEFFRKYGGSESIENFAKRVYLSSIREIEEPQYIDKIKEEYRFVSYEELVSMLRSFDVNVETYGGSSKEKITSILELVNFNFPQSFVDFLVQLGRVDIYDYHISGIFDKDPAEGILWATNLMKLDHNLPDGYFCLEYDHDWGTVCCLDLTRELVEPPVIEYHYKKEKFGGTLYSNFDVFFRNVIGGKIDFHRGLPENQKES